MYLTERLPNHQRRHRSSECTPHILAPCKPLLNSLLTNFVPCWAPSSSWLILPPFSFDAIHRTSQLRPSGDLATPFSLGSLHESIFIVQSFWALYVSSVIAYVLASTVFSKKTVHWPSAFLTKYHPSSTPAKTEISVQKWPPSVTKIFIVYLVLPLGYFYVWATNTFRRPRKASFA